MRGSLGDRFWAKVRRAGPDECWPWLGGRYPSGYGSLRVGETHQAAHRVSYLIEHGTIPASALILHHCDNPPCCNPAHLYAGSHTDNAGDRERRGRANHAVGERNGSRTHPESYPRGSDSTSARHPERLPHGDDHWTRRQPERLSRGDDNWTRQHPDLLLRGERNPQARLTEDLVRQIRARYPGESQQAIADSVGVSQRLVSGIVRRRTWVHVL